MAQRLSVSCYKGEAVRLNFCLNPFTVTTGDTANGQATVNVLSTASFPSTGTFYLEGIAVTYTGLTATAFTGCSGTPATSYPVPAALGGADVVGCRDVTGWTTVFTVKRHATDAAAQAVLSVAGSIVSTAGAVFKALLTKAQTNIAAATYACDFWRTDASSESALGVGNPAQFDGDGFIVTQDVLN